MDFDFTKDEKLIQSSIREFFEKECPSDKVRELEEDERGCGAVLSQGEILGIRDGRYLLSS